MPFLSETRSVSSLGKEESRREGVLGDEFAGSSMCGGSLIPCSAQLSSRRAPARALYSAQFTKPALQMLSSQTHVVRTQSSVSGVTCGGRSAPGLGSRRPHPLWGAA